MIPPAPALIERFGAGLADLLGRPPGSGGPIALAVSGGPDSMAMLALATTAFPGQVIAATVDHGLRPESAAEAEMVAQSCAGIGAPHTTLAIEVPPRATGNLHSWARQERYLRLKRWAIGAGACCLCTGHHAEDQAETFLMRAARASGLSGLAAIRARREDPVSSEGQTHTAHMADGFVVPVDRREITLVRPLLRWRRAELRALAETCALPFVDDPSNADPRFARTRFRRWLEQADWIDPVQIGRSAEHLADADADMQAVSRWLWGERSQPCDPLEARIDVAGLPREIRRYIARSAIGHVRSAGGMSDGRALGSIERLLDALEGGGGATHADVQASAKGDIWHFREAPPRR